MINIFTLIFVFSLLTSCSVHREKLANINEGMNKQEIIHVLGEPDDIRIDSLNMAETMGYDMRTSLRDPRCTQFTFFIIPLNSCELKLRYDVVLQNDQLVSVVEEDSHLARRAKLPPLRIRRSSKSFYPNTVRSRQNPWRGSSQRTDSPNLGAFFEGAWDANNK